MRCNFSQRIIKQLKKKINGEKMKILFLASTDSFNFALPPLINEAKKHGHEIDVYSTEFGYEHTWMFKKENIILKKITKTTPKIKDYDAVIFQAVRHPNIINQLKKENVPAFSIYNHLPEPHYVLGDNFSIAHFTFCLGDHFIQWQRNNGVKQVLIPTGSPQYDHLFDIKKNTKKSNKVLILDAHYYPSHPEGKEELAKILLELAKKEPEKELIVKPRTIPSQTSEARHKAEHLYDYIYKISNNQIPKNLNLLTDHKDLNDLTANSDIIISTFTSAFLPAMLLNKPIIILRDLKHLNLEVWHNKAINSFYDYLAESGCVINYNQLLEAFDLATPANPQFVKKLHYKFDGLASKRIIDFVETCVKNKLISKKNLSENDYCVGGISEFFNNIEENKEEVNIKKDFFLINFIYNYYLHQYFLFNFRSGFLLQKEYEEFQKKANVLRKEYIHLNQTENKFETDLHEFFKIEIEKSIKNIIDSNKTLLPGFKGMIIEKWFEANHYERIFKLPKEFHIPDYYYYSGRICEIKGERQKAIEFFETYLKECENHFYLTSHALWDAFKDDARERIKDLKYYRGYKRKIKDLLRPIKHKLMK